MARKKNLSDLLREEVEKTPDTEAAPVPSPPLEQSTSEEVSMSPAAASRRTQQTKKTTSKTTRSAPKSPNRMTKADLQEQVSGLSEALQAAQDQGVTLQQKVTELEAALAKQMGVKDEQKVAIEQTQALKTELEAVKKDALKLAKENKRLAAQAEKLKQENADLKQELQAQAKRPKTSMPQKKELPSKQPLRRVPPQIPERSILARPIRPAPPVATPGGRRSRSFESWCYD